jgi:hypothetical protein
MGKHELAVDLMSDEALYIHARSMLNLVIYELEGYRLLGIEASRLRDVRKCLIELETRGIQLRLPLDDSDYSRP